MSAPEPRKPSLTDVIHAVLLVGHRSSGHIRNFKTGELDEYTEFHGSTRALAERIAEALRPGKAHEPIEEV